MTLMELINSDQRPHYGAYCSDETGLPSGARKTSVKGWVRIIPPEPGVVWDSRQNIEAAIAIIEAFRVAISERVAAKGRTAMTPTAAQAEARRIVRESRRLADLRTRVDPNQPTPDWRIARDAALVGLIARRWSASSGRRQSRCSGGATLAGPGSCCLPR